MIEIYTDGSSCGNPGKGGYGVVAIENGKVLYQFGDNSYDEVTNNQMELMALIHALGKATEDWWADTCLIYSDSAYCVNSFNSWIKGWARNGWKNSKKKEVENIELMKILYNYLNIDFPNFQVIKVKGHNGNLGNELADALATGNQKKIQKILSDESFAGQI